MQMYIVVWNRTQELLWDFERQWRVSRHRAANQPQTLFDRYYPSVS